MSATVFQRQAQHVPLKSEYNIHCPIHKCKFPWNNATTFYVTEGGGGGYIWRGDLTEGFLRYRFEGLYLEGLISGILRYLTVG